MLFVSALPPLISSKRVVPDQPLQSNTFLPTVTHMALHLAADATPRRTCLIDHHEHASLAKLTLAEQALRATVGRLAKKKKKKKRLLSWVSAEGLCANACHVS